MTNAYMELGGEYRNLNGDFRSWLRTGKNGQRRQTPARNSYDSRKRLIRTHSNYSDVTLHPSWENFQNFALWFYKNCVPGWDLDKDIKSKVLGVPRQYGPDTCIFVPEELNSFGGRNAAQRGPYLQGVIWYKQTSRFLARYKRNHKSTHIGYYLCEFEAARAYIDKKREYGMELVKKYPTVGEVFEKYLTLYCAELEADVAMKQNLTQPI